jgi:two-component system NtrC family sensor kinase
MNESAMPLAWVQDLYLLSQVASKHGDPRPIQSLILQRIVAAVGADNGSLAICSEEQPDNLVIVAGTHLPSGVIGSTIRLGEGIIGWVAKEGTALLLNGDISSDSRFSGLAARASHPASAMCWPLVIENRVIGALSANRSQEGHRYTEEDLEHGRAMVNLVAVVIENARLHLHRQRQIAELSRINQALVAANKQLEEAQKQLLQSEKMASIGQLAAGVAHEINNPIGYVYSNLGTLDRYLKDLLSVLDAYEKAEGEVSGNVPALAAVHAVKRKVDLSFLREDLQALMSESRDGITRVKQIVQNLKDFSRADVADEWQWADLHRGLDSTLNIVANEIKYKAEVVKEYGQLPDIECLPSQLNQVFMNLLVNAAHAIEERGVITLRSGKDLDQVWVEIADTGKGIPAENLNRIFDPFFTTKPVGKGTGLGLSLSYSIVQKHHGHIDVSSEVGKGSTFRVWLPIRQPESAAVS